MMTNARHVLRNIAGATAVLVAFATAAPTFANSDPTPSTNDANRDKGWAHVNQVGSGPGVVSLEFVSTRGFVSCFEFRTDGDTTQILSENGGVNYNPEITDGLYPYTCVNNSTALRMIFADEYVEVRMVFGAEKDERFDWTRFDVAGKEACKNDGWMQFGFRNQGQCVRFAQTGKDSR